ncbi:hypothetical protein K439DRAFT_1613320 [Ramaria rubella]|nr:hypothetical protein K439DRAFT_1613320 [Ramaria rubella]
MSPTSLPQHLPPLAAIAPHLLHSPTQSPTDATLPSFMDAYRDPAPDSPSSLCYPPSPEGDAASSFPSPPLTSAVLTTVSSPSGMLVVHSYGPASGSAGSVLTARIDFTNLKGTNVRLRIVFGDLALPTLVGPNSPSQQCTPGQEHGGWKLSITIPKAGHASRHTAQITQDGIVRWPLTLQALDEGGNILETMGFGFFSYIPMSPRASPPSSPSSYEYSTGDRSPGSNKRLRGDEDSDYSPPTPTKRLATGTDGLHLHQTSNSASEEAFVRSQQRSAVDRTFLGASQTADSQIGVSMNSHDIQRLLHSQDPLHQSIRGNLQSHNLQGASTASFNPVDNSDYGAALVRTSQLGHDTRPEQASLVIEGDLQSMKRSWLESERAAGRRLVQFWKSQIGTTLHISFAAIPQSAYRENTIVVSCIYKDDNNFFITSVDVIYLLEALSGGKFEVEEKNRIRRNLEGFKPITISKSRAGTEEYFRSIMDMPCPKPRNIEKDIKVFEWGKLKMMLEKVFSKYSTVPFPLNPPFPNETGPVNEPPPGPHPVSGTPRDDANLPRSIIAPGLRPEKKLSFEQPSLAPLNHFPQNQSAPAAYSQQFLPVNYESTGGYSYSGMRLFEPLQNNRTLLRVDTALEKMGSSVMAGSHHGHHDGYDSGSPNPCNDSPLSISLSISSGTSAEDGPIENHDPGLPDISANGVPNPQVVNA